MDAERIRAFLLKLPHVVETVQWTGKLVFWTGDKAVGGKMFVVLDLDGAGKAVLSYATCPERYAELVEVEGVFPAPYMARIWWVAVERWDVFRPKQWEQELHTAYDLTLHKLPPRTHKALQLPKQELLQLIAERKALLESRAANKKKAARARSAPDSHRRAHGSPTRMKHMIFGAMLMGSLFPASLRAQARDIPSAAPIQTAGKNQEERGHLLLDQMVTALGGELWLNRRTLYEEGHTASFFRGAPTGSVVDFWSFRQFSLDGKADLERIEYTKKREVVHIWTKDTGYEITYKGKTTLPKLQIDDYLRRQAHSIEAVIGIWLKQPGVIVLAEGTAMVERRMVDKVTVLSANNDAVTIDLDVNTHLPLRRTFEWRNETFKDHDEDAEEYDDYHTIQGFPTPFTITRYHNGDMASQLFFRKVEYGNPIAPELFDPNRPVKKVHNLD